jgi:FixJ family two-component response regulator
MTAAAVGGRVLVIEDDDSLREALARLLGAAGYDSATYSSAEALLANGGVTGTGCLVCDLRLPAMSGLDLLAELRSHPAPPPMILITAHDAPGLREEALRKGAAAYLAKPFPGTVLLDAVKTALESASSS